MSKLLIISFLDLVQCHWGYIWIFSAAAIQTIWVEFLNGPNALSKWHHQWSPPSPLFKSKSDTEIYLATMPSNVDPHGVPLHACVHSRTAQGPKAAVTLSLNPFLPCRPADQPRRRTGLSQHVASEAVQLEGSVARWLDVGNCFEVKLYGPTSSFC